jgi:hypothetical protein
VPAGLVLDPQVGREDEVRTRLVSIDPSTRDLAWARWDGKTLVACGLYPFDKLWVAGEWCRNVGGDVLVVEEPMVYHGAKNTKGADAEDLIQLAKVVGACATFRGHVTFLKPANWKGQIPKDVCWMRSLKRLSVQEAAVYDAAIRQVGASKRHNVHDAIGLGLYYLGRLAP